MITLPKEIMVLGKPYKIKVVEDHGQDVSGWLEDEVIHINLPHVNEKDIDNDIMYTICHELGHAIFRRSSLVQVIDDKLEEIVVDMFAKVFVEAFVITFRKKQIILPD